MYKLKNYPKFLRVLGENIVLHFSSEEVADSDDGHYEHGKKTITLRDSYESRELAEWTLMHELCHTVFKNLAGQLDEHLEEIYCDNIAKTIAKNFRITPRR